MFKGSQLAESEAEAVKWYFVLQFFVPKEIDHEFQEGKFWT